SLILLIPGLASAQTAKFKVDEATIEDIQSAILRGKLTSTRVVELYLNRIKAYNGTCVNQPDGALGLGPIIPIKNARQLNARMTPPSSSGCGKRARLFWPRQIWEKWERRTRAAPSAGHSAILTTPHALLAPRAAAPELPWPQTW